MTDALPHARRWPWAILGLTSLLTAALLCRWLLATPPTAERQPAPRQARLVTVSPFVPSDHPVTLTAHGTVITAQQVELTAQVSGRVVRLLPALVPGHIVAAGEPLLRLETSDYELALIQARAELHVAEAALTEESGQRAVAEADFDLLQLEVTEAERHLMLRAPQYQAALAEVTAAKARLREAEINLERCTVRAPFRARVLSRSVSIGAEVTAGSTSIATLAAASPYWVELKLPVDQLHWLQTSQANVDLFDVSRPDLPPWPGKILNILDAVESEGRRARVLVEVDPDGSTSGQRLLLGSYMEARIHAGVAAGSYTVPANALSGDTVWVMRKGRLAALPVEVLHANDDQLLVRAAPEPDDQLITSQLDRTVPGMRLRTDSSPANPPLQPDAPPTPPRQPEQPA